MNTESSNNTQNKTQESSCLGKRKYETISQTWEDFKLPSFDKKLLENKEYKTYVYKQLIVYNEILTQQLR